MLPGLTMSWPALEFEFEFILMCKIAHYMHDAYIQKASDVAVMAFLAKKKLAENLA